MSLSAEDLGWLVARLSSELPEVREEAAETVTDWEPVMTDFQKRLVVRLLSLLASAESSRRVREAQLNAVVSIFLPPLMTKADVAPLLEMAVDTLDRQDVNYIDGFLDALAEFPDEESRTVQEERLRLSPRSRMS